MDLTHLEAGGGVGSGGFLKPTCSHPPKDEGTWWGAARIWAKKPNPPFLCLKAWDLIHFEGVCE